MKKTSRIFLSGETLAGMRGFAVCALTAVLATGCRELSEQTLKQWATASDSAKDKVIAAHFADHAEYVKKCMNRMAASPNTENVKILDAGGLCTTGFRLKERNARSNAKR
jgi:hypothetical protein